MPTTSNQLNDDASEAVASMVSLSPAFGCHVTVVPSSSPLWLITRPGNVIAILMSTDWANSTSGVSPEAAERSSTPLTLY